MDALGWIAIIGLFAAAGLVFVHYLEWNRKPEELTEEEEEAEEEEEKPKHTVLWIGFSLLLAGAFCSFFFLPAIGLTLSVIGAGFAIWGMVKL